MEGDDPDQIRAYENINSQISSLNKVPQSVSIVPHIIIFPKTLQKIPFDASIVLDEENDSDDFDFVDIR